MSGNINSNFNNQSIFKAGMEQPKNKQQSKEEVQKEEKSQPTVVNTKFSSEDIQDFMNASGIYAQAYIQKTNASNIDPAKYLTPERIADIEKSMAKFDTMFDEVYSAITAEFGDAISENAKQQLALHSLS